ITDTQATGTIQNDDGVYWTGASGDGMWSTAANWTTGNVPNTNTEVAHFDDRCAPANCNVTVDSNLALEGIDVQAPFAGTITQGAYTLDLDRGFYLESGTFLGSS